MFSINFINNSLWGGSEVFVMGNPEKRKNYDKKFVNILEYIFF